jgi:hypothetical protein
LADIARGFRSGAEFLRQGTVGRCAAPSDASCRGVDALEERVLLAEIEPEAGKIRLLAFEMRFAAATASATSGVGAAAPRPGSALLRPIASNRIGGCLRKRKRRAGAGGAIRWLQFGTARWCLC